MRFQSCSVSIETFGRSSRASMTTRQTLLPSSTRITHAFSSLDISSSCSYHFVHCPYLPWGKSCGLSNAWLSLLPLEPILKRMVCCLHHRENILLLTSSSFIIKHTDMDVLQARRANNAPIRARWRQATRISCLSRQYKNHSKASFREGPTASCFISKVTLCAALLPASRTSFLPKI